MNSRLGQHMTLLGLSALAFYGTMLATGYLPLEVMPQFLISAIIFLSSGRMLRRVSRQTVRDEEEKPSRKSSSPKQEPDWPWLTGLLNWSAAMAIIGLMAIFLMKPAGVSLKEAAQQTEADQQFFATSVP